MVARPLYYLRFALLDPHPDTGVAAGVFFGAYELQRGHGLTSDDRQELDALLNWFRKELPIPDRFTRTKSKGHYRRATKGVSWFKPEAKVHIGRMRDLKRILDRYGYIVEEISTQRPGYLLYEDQHQIVAEPFTEAR